MQPPEQPLAPSMAIATLLRQEREQGRATSPAALQLLAEQVRYQLRLLLRTPRALYSAFLLPILLLAAVGTSGSGSAARRAELIVGITAFAVISTAFITHATGLVSARDRGTLKRLRGTPLPPWAYFAGRIGATVLLALAAAAATLVAAVVILQAQVPLAAVPGLLLGSVVGALAWAALGTAATRLVPDAGAAWPILSAAFLPVVLVSGVFFPLTSEPTWLAQTVRWLPAEPFVHTLGAAMAEQGVGDARDLAVLLVWGGAGLLLALRTFRWEQPAGAGTTETA